MEGLREGSSVKITKPEKIEGILLKRRTWPMKGWHKRYFLLNDGIMTYAKSKNDVSEKKKSHLPQKKKFHWSLKNNFLYAGLSTY